jgi:hypothetical protein
MITKYKQLETLVDISPNLERESQLVIFIFVATVASFGELLQLDY